MRVVGNVSSTVRAQLRKGFNFSLHRGFLRGDEGDEGGNRGDMSWGRKPAKSGTVRICDWRAYH